MRKRLYHIFILFLFSGILATPCMAETEDSSTKPAAVADSGEIAQALSFLHDMTDTDYVELCVSCAVQTGAEAETMEALCSVISEQLETVFQDELFQPAQYVLDVFDTCISGYTDPPINLAMYWDQAEENYIIGCVLQCKDVRPAFRLFIQRYEDEYVPGISDILELPFGLSYGAGEAEIWEKLGTLPVQYCVFNPYVNEERGCFTIFLPDGGPVEYMQLFTESFDFMQSYASYARSDFGYPLEKQLSEVIYHMDSTYNVKEYSDGLTPLLDEKWGTRYKETGAVFKEATWTYWHDTEEIMKGAPILRSKFWTDFKTVALQYDLAVLSANAETNRYKLRYDGRRGVALEIINSWILTE